AGAILDTVREWGGGLEGAGEALMFLLVGLVGLALFGAPVDGRRVELDFRTRPGVRGLALVCFATLAVAQVAALVVSSAFVVRYTSLVFPLFILVAAFGVLAFAGDDVRRGVLAVAVVFGL